MYLSYETEPLCAEIIINSVQNLTEQQFLNILQQMFVCKTGNGHGCLPDALNYENAV